MSLTDIDTKLSKCDSQDRCFVFIDYFSGVQTSAASNQQFWNVLSRWWSSFDPINHTMLSLIMSEFQYDESYLDDKVIPPSHFFKGNDKLTAYRGVINFNENREIVTGLSWTTDKAVARHYAEIADRDQIKGDKYIQECQFQQSDIAFFDNSRNEAEFVIFNMKHVISRVEKL